MSRISRERRPMRGKVVFVITEIRRSSATLGSTASKRGRLHGLLPRARLAVCGRRSSEAHGPPLATCRRRKANRGVSGAPVVY